MDPTNRLSRAAKVAYAKHMRRDQTSLERYAWSLLRDRGILGLKFRRQHILVGFIVDFVCLHAKVILEVDGPHHADSAHGDYDRARDAQLAAAGFKVVRVGARELTRERLEQLLRRFASPLPKGEGTEG